MEILLPHTIENTTGEKLTFLRITIKNGIEYLEGENEVKPNADPGQTVLFKAGTPHKFWNAGNDILHCSGCISPADNAV